MIIAHRGASGDAPENTIPAFELAWKQKADGIEGDFHLTKDGHVVCIHDHDTSRVSETNLVIEESSLEQLRQIDVGSYRGNQFKNALIPTLGEVLATVPSCGRVYLEIKTGKDIIPPMLSIIKQSAVSPDRITFISFSREVIRELKTIASPYRAFLLWAVDKTDGGSVEPSTEIVLSTLAEIDADGISTNTAAINEAYISSIKSEGYEYHVWTVDDPQRARALLDWGVDSITTNVPELIRDACGHLGG